MDSRKPLTAGRIEELRDYATACINCCEVEPGELRALLDMLPPPTDAAVREAVAKEALEQLEYDLNKAEYAGQRGSSGEWQFFTWAVDALVKVYNEERHENAILRAEWLNAETQRADLEEQLRAVQAPRMTEEQVEAVKIAETLLTDTMSDYGDCEHDLGHCICKYHSGVFAIRAAFPELAGEVDRG